MWNTTYLTQQAATVRNADTQTGQPSCLAVTRNQQTLY